MISGLTCLWYIRDTNIMINRKHTKHYELKMRYYKVEYSTAAGLYCMMHDVEVPCCMSEFSSSKIIEHRPCVENDIGESGIGYDIIGCDLMIRLVLTADLKRQFPQWDGLTVLMKGPSGLLGKS